MKGLVWSEVKGEVDALSSSDTNQLSLLLRLWNVGSDGIRSRRNLDVEIVTCFRNVTLKKEIVFA